LISNAGHSAMKRSTDRILVSHVGSLVRPPAIRDVMWARERERGYDEAVFEKTLKDVRLEVELGFDIQQAFLEAERCLNCDVQTVFDTPKCIECDACVDICPMDCITFTANGEEEDLRAFYAMVTERLGKPAQVN